MISGIEELKKSNMKSDKKDMFFSHEKGIEEKLENATNSIDKKFYSKVLTFLRAGENENSDFMKYFSVIEGIFLSSDKGVRGIISENLFKEETRIEIKIGNVTFSKKV